MAQEHKQWQENFMGKVFNFNFTYILFEMLEVFIRHFHNIL